MSDPRPAPSSAGSLLLGIGLGGFVDGIVLHQILQWHHMVSHVPRYRATTLSGLEANTLADGLLHALAWLFVLAGTTALLVSWRQGRRAPSWGFHVGLLLAGWGVFNVVEGMVNHHLLGLHHVREDLGSPLAWDLGFLAFGALLALGGWALYRRNLPPGASSRHR